MIPLVSYPELLSWGSAAFLGRHRGRATGDVTSSVLPKDCESISVLLLWCNVPQIVVILAGCSTAGKHILMIWRNALVVSYSCPLFKYWVCSLACFPLSFEMCMSWRIVLVCMVTSLIPCYLITLAPLLWNVLVRCHVKRMNIHLQLQSFFSPLDHLLLVFLISFLILLVVDLNDFLVLYNYLMCFPLWFNTFALRFIK